MNASMIAILVILVNSHQPTIVRITAIMNTRLQIGGQGKFTIIEPKHSLQALIIIIILQIPQREI